MNTQHNNENIEKSINVIKRGMINSMDKSEIIEFLLKQNVDINDINAAFDEYRESLGSVSLNIYTKSYSKSIAAKQCFNAFCSNNSRFFANWCLLLISISVLCGCVYSSTFIFEKAAQRNQYAATNTIDGECILMERDKEEKPCNKEKENGGCYGGTKFEYVWKIYNFSKCSEYNKSNYTLKQEITEGGGEQYEYRYDINDIKPCYSNKKCDEIYMDKGEVHNDGTGLFIGSIAVILIGICCCGGIYYYVPCSNIKYLYSYKCSSDIICKYIKGEIKEEYRSNQWNEEMTIYQRYDYFISYYFRSYNLKISDDIYQLLYLFVEKPNIK